MMTGFIPKSNQERGQFSKQQQQSFSYDYMPYLPDELVFLILQKLPIKSILRFTCVSKSWSDLFKTDSFIQNHQNRRTMLLINRPFPPPPPPNTTPNDCHGFSFHNLDSPEEELRPCIPARFYENLLGIGSNINLDLMRPQANIRGIHGSVNGIICLRYGNSLHNLYILCNPALCQFKLLPPCLEVEPPPLQNQPVKYMPIETIDGFGVSNITHGFKVINMQKFYSNGDNGLAMNVIARVYDFTPGSDSGSWREVKNVPLEPVYPVTFSGHVIYFNGACHWSARTFSVSPELKRIRKGILSFDMTSERFRHLELPDCLQGIAVPQPVVMDNCLAVVKYKMFDNEMEPVEFWVMKQYGDKESWTKFFEISPQPYASAFLPWKGDVLMVEEPWRNTEIDLGVLEGSISRDEAQLNGQLTSVDLGTKEMKRFQIFGPSDTMRALIYEESLVRLY